MKKEESLRICRQKWNSCGTQYVDCLLSYSLLPIGLLLISAEELALSDVRRIGIQVSINIMSLQSSKLEKLGGYSTAKF